VSPASAELPTHDGNFPLHLACVSGDVSVIDHLIAVARKADRDRCRHAADTVADRDACVLAAVNVLDVRRRSPLHVAVINRRLDAVRRLLSVRGSADGGGPTTGGRVLRRCRSIDRPPLVDIDAADADGYSPLHLAVVGDDAHAYVDIVSLLLQCGADVNQSPTTVTSCDGGGGRSSVDATMSSILGLACRRHDVSTAELLLHYGACDADLAIMTSAIANSDTEVIGVLLSRQHAYADTKFPINRAAMLSIPGHCASDTVDSTTPAYRATVSGSSLSPLMAIMLDWRALKLERVVETWLSQACLSYLRMCQASVAPPPWLLQNAGVFATYLITRIDVSENHLITLPSLLFSLPSLRILIAAGNQVRRCRVPSEVFVSPAFCMA